MEDDTKRNGYPASSPPPAGDGARGPAEDEIDLRELLSILRRNRWVIAGCAAGAVVLAGLYTLLATPIYEASTTIRIDEEETNVPVLEVLRSVSQGSQVETEMEVLRSRSVAEQVVEDLALQLAVTEPDRTPRSELFSDVRVPRLAAGDLDETYRLERSEDDEFTVYHSGSDEALATADIGESLKFDGMNLSLARGAAEHSTIRLAVTPFSKRVDRLREMLSVRRPNPDANVTTVRYESPDRRLVAGVTNALAVRFIERRQEVRKTEARSTVTFLQSQIDTLSAQLRAGEDTLREFRESEQVVNLETQASSQVDQLAQIQGERNSLEAERSSLAELLEEARRAPPASLRQPSPFRGLMAFPSLLRSPATSELLQSVSDLENRRAELLQRRTPEDPDVEALTLRIQEIEGQLQTIAENYLAGLTSQVASLDGTLGRFGDELESIPAKEVRLARLERQTGVLNEIFTLLQTRLKEAEIARAVEDPSVRVVDPAILPTEPIKPRGPLNLVLGLMLGLMVGVGGAFAREYRDTAVHTQEDVEIATGVPLLAHIPRIEEAALRDANGDRQPAKRDGGGSRRGARRSDRVRLIATRDPRKPASEAYRTLRTNIAFARAEGVPRVLVATSPMPRDGKSTSAGNLSLTMAEQGLRTLLVDADMRRGVLDETFGLDRAPGLSEILVGSASLEESLHEYELEDGNVLHLLTSGTRPPNPAELLGSDSMAALLARFREEFEATVLDAPPLNLVTDAAVLGSRADGVVLVARASETNQNDLSHAADQLRRVRAPIIGTLLNDFRFDRDGRYYGTYGGPEFSSYYGEED